MILTCSKPTDRARMLSQWIQVAMELRSFLGNLFGFTVVMEALLAPQVCIENFLRFILSRNTPLISKCHQFYLLNHCDTYLVPISNTLRILLRLSLLSLVLFFVYLVRDRLRCSWSIWLSTCIHVYHIVVNLIIKQFQTKSWKHQQLSTLPRIMIPRRRWDHGFYIQEILIHPPV